MIDINNCTYTYIPFEAPLLSKRNTISICDNVHKEHHKTEAFDKSDRITIN